MRCFLAFLLFSVTALAQTNPVPWIANPLVPTAVTPGSGAFMLTVNGTGFVPGSTVYWNGSPRTTTYVSAAQLTAAINASDVASATSGVVTVRNSAAPASNVALLLVTSAASTLFFGTASIPQAFGTNEWSFLAGDLNGDGFPDITVSPGNNLEAVIGMGNGGFQYPVNYPIPDSTQVSAGVLADFNNDGTLDFAAEVSSNSFRALDVFLGNGDGTFQPALQEFVGQSYAPFAVGDFNGDGKLDFVTGTSEGLEIMLGNGDGTFSVGSQVTLAHGAAAASVGDFNRDGVLDIAVSTHISTGGGGQISVLLGNGDGTFAAPVSYTAGYDPFLLAVGDLNGDGFPDIATTDVNEIFYVFINNGDGTFRPAVEYNGPSPAGGFGDAVFADFHGDGKLDFATENSDCIDDCLEIFAGNGDGTFQPGVAYLHRQDQGSSTFGYLAISDFNLDGKIDVVFPGGTDPFVMLQSVAPEIAIDPGSLSFAAQPVGSESSNQYVTLLQLGTAPVTINTIASSGDFLQSNQCTGIVISAQCYVTVNFLPTATGVRNGMLTINTSGGSQYVGLSGIGNASLSITVSPTALSFPIQTLNALSSYQDVNITNTGSQTVDFTSFILTGANPGDFLLNNQCSSTLAVGANCNVQVAFRPSAQGLRTATLNIADNAANNPQIVALSGLGDALHVSTNLLEFGNVKQGSSDSLPLTLRNLGSKAIAVSQIKFDVNAADYSQTNTCGGSIPPRSFCTMTVTFSPQAQGQLNSVLSFSTNGTGMQATSTVSLKGRGD